jgi:hypothetical protein
MVRVRGFEPLCFQLPFHLLRRQRGYTRMSCLECNTPTANPKFCSRSCAALYNNRRSDINRRKPEGSCRTCDQPIKASRSYCQKCREEKEGSLVLGAESSNAGKNPYIRNQARRHYIVAERPLFCAICHYSAHVDICHIKDVRSYPTGTPYSTVNTQENLLALCKNHHWEFDHGILLFSKPTGVRTQDTQVKGLLFFR